MEEKNSKTIYDVRHFKGARSFVITVAQHSETGEKLVVYRCMDNNGKTNHKDGIYARPLEMFLSEVDHEKYPDAQTKISFWRNNRIINSIT